MITQKIIVTQPTLDQIERYGEKRYFSAMRTLTSVGADLKWQLWDHLGIDYTQISDYDLFIRYIAGNVSSKRQVKKELLSDPEKYKDMLDRLNDDDLREMDVNPLQLILKDIDLGDFVPCKTEYGDIVLYNREQDIKIDRAIHAQMIDVIRQIHGWKRNNETPANETTKMNLIEDARDEAMASSKKPYKSILKPLISAMMCKTGMCGDERIWNMPIGMFFDNIKRLYKIQDATMLLQGAYSGFASLKGVDKSRFDWSGDL